MVEVEPHDLLEINSINDLSGDRLPDWAEQIFSNSLTVVVRRQKKQGDLIPVGIRGIKREHRFATYLSEKKIKKVITPFDLVQDEAWTKKTTRFELPAIKALPKVAQILSNYRWGISGSVGFELATRTKAAKMTSDLDLILKTQTPIDKISAKKLLEKLNQFGVHADLQVILGSSGFSLEEYANSSKTIMMKTISGPILVENPWTKE
ncbi:malonate decarboxylase holo-ACP synthase [Companilactobacillus halodurans]|uniref:Malonate decarboxylase holo-ACP synthase n=1 Tax=Companilactobacillus halodurans TaxID=2584183 RepID=A0A5P0ZNL8_9LACO|nr:malonate decarboxylase holo-ACP synthase [Companilactobacillus halodurans]MQS75808.1 malonate decarboxylase holo-ACP synthase [Companilactobacillus halodurans]MQS97981.1 malonate decarboxylase holo-ACP synthase [Companilactobacillus halodurans]